MQTTHAQYVRGAWGTAVLIDDQLWRVRLTHPHGGLTVNTYIFCHRDALIIIDPGWPWTLDGLSEALKDNGIADDLSKVTHWLYTHSHIDHMGAAAILADCSDAPHFAKSSMLPHLEQWHLYQDKLADWSGWVERAFAQPAKDALLEQMITARDHGSRRPLLELYGPRSITGFQPLEVGQVFNVGGLDIHVLDASGHDMHHVAFWIPQKGWLFSGDVLLPVPTPISPPMQDDLAAYERTLERFEQYTTNWLLPGHGVHMKGVRLDEAIARARSFVQHYRTSIRAYLLKCNKPIDLHQLALDLTPTKKPLTPSTRWWVHLALTDSHLRWLIEHEDDVVEIPSKQGPMFWT